MRAIIARGYSGPDVLEVVAVPVPAPGPRQVLIRVEAATVDPVDAATRSGALADAGLMPPRESTGIGWDVAGFIEHVGPEVTAFTVGQRVIGLRDLLDRTLCAYAEFIVLEAGAVAPAPRDVPASAAATPPLNGLTAAQSPDLMELTPGDTLLVTGAVGGFAVELAVHRGLQVVALAGDRDHGWLRDPEPDGSSVATPMTWRHGSGCWSPRASTGPSIPPVRESERWRLCALAAHTPPSSADPRRCRCAASESTRSGSARTGRL